MLEAFGKDLTIINMQWLPESQTMLAVGTKNFVRIYELAEDNISPKFNLMLFDNAITDFTFTKPCQSLKNTSQLVVNIIVSTKNGTIYHEDITYGGEGSNKNKDADM